MPSLSDPYPAVSVVGTGHMGRPIAARLLDAAQRNGTTLTVHARHRERVADLLADGAVWAADPSELAAAPVILSVLPDLPELEQLLWGDAGIVAAVTRPTVLLIASTSSPEGVRQLANRLDDASGGLIDVLDCPVSGGTEGAATGKLAIMVGGEQPAVSRALPVLQQLGEAVHLGPLGAGQVAKACNQAIVASTVLALSEAAILAERSGIDVSTLFRVLSGGYAGGRILETRGRRIAERDYRVAGPARYMVKDLGFALAEAEHTGTVLPQTRGAYDTFCALTELGLGDDDISVARAFIERLSTIPERPDEGTRTR